MKKLRKKFKIVSIILSIFLVCSINNIYVYADEGDEAYENDGNHTFNQMNFVLEEGLENDDIDTKDFINNYAGGVIKNDHLTIFLKDEVNDLDWFYSKMLENDISQEKYDIQFVDYSYTDLENQISSFWEYRNNNLITGEEWAPLVYSVAISQEYNCIMIFVDKDFEISNYNELNDFLSSISYRFEYTDEPQLEENTTLKPGMGISTGGSIGFRCKINNEKGFITAVHTSNYSSLPAVKYNGTTIGSITAGAYGNSADFAFVKITNSSYSMSLTTNTSPSYTLHSSHYVVSLAQGYTVYMAGKQSSTVRTGTVVYYSSSVSGDSGTDWLICSFTGIQGDSGGVIFAVVSGDNCVVGIYDGNYGTNSYATKLTRMQSSYSTLTIY